MHRHDDLRARGRIAGYVAGECLDVGNDLRTARRRGGAADALAERDAHAGGLALEGTYDELATAVEIEARPVEAGQGVEHEGREIRGVRDAIALPGEQRAGLLRELRVMLGLRGGFDRGDFVHVAILAGAARGGSMGLA